MTSKIIPVSSFDILATSPHFLCKKHMGTREENLYFDNRYLLSRQLQFLLCNCKGMSFLLYSL